jgi:hypothetical protein
VSWSCEQKHGARHALREVLPQRLLGGMNRVSASSTGSFPENKVGAPPMNERLIGTERRSLTTGRVAFVITNTTRAKLAALGHSTEKVFGVHVRPVGWVGWCYVRRVPNSISSSNKDLEKLLYYIFSTRCVPSSHSLPSKR